MNMWTLSCWNGAVSNVSTQLLSQKLTPLEASAVGLTTDNAVAFGKREKGTKGDDEGDNNEASDINGSNNNNFLYQ